MKTSKNKRADRTEDERVVVRLTKKDKCLIRAVAGLKGITMTELIVDWTRQEARRMNLPVDSD